MKNSKNDYDVVFKVGDILCSSWGYDQTNIHFYSVVSRTAKSLKIVRIGNQMVGEPEFLAEYVVPDLSDVRDKVMLKRINVYEGKENFVKIADYAYAYLWDGKPKYQTHYH